MLSAAMRDAKFPRFRRRQDFVSIVLAMRTWSTTSTGKARLGRAAALGGAAGALGATLIGGLVSWRGRLSFSLATALKAPCIAS